MRTLSLTSIAAAISASLLSIGVAAAAGVEAKKKFYSDDPVWSMPRPVPAKNVAARKLSEYYDFLSNTFHSPGEHAPHHNEWLPSQGINTVDEVPDSAWYTNRHASRRMSVDELKTGAGDSTAPAAGQWTVIAAKNEGVTPGFRIRDAAGRQYFLKFDPVTNPELASAADVITSRFFYALGYNVPENYIVYFDRARMTVGENAQMKDAAGHIRAIKESDIAEMLARTPLAANGKYRGMASLMIPGKPLGPFLYHTTRSDDPNDLIDHEHRRDLRALRTLCAWLGHDDSKSINSLDMLATEDGTPFVKHYLIDFGATLGSASLFANSPRDGNVYLFDWKSSAMQFFTLGLYAPKWQHAKYPKLPAVGRFESEVFDPERWVGDYPNAAFRNENQEDRIWAARKIAAITEEDIRAIVSTGQYSDPAAADWVARCLIERRKKILAAYLAGTAGLGDFEVHNDRLESVYAGLGGKPAVQVQWAVFDNATGQRRALTGQTSTQLPGEVADYLVAEITGAQGPAISVYVRVKADRKFVIGVERHFDVKGRKRPAGASHVDS